MAPKRCVVQDCARIADKKSGISIHYSPESTGRLWNEWVRFVRTNRGNFKPTGRFGVCSMHFEQDKFVRQIHIAGFQRRLVRGAVPTIWKQKSEALSQKAHRTALKEILSQHEQNVRPSNNTASPGILSECAIDKLPEASGSAVVQMAAPPSSDTASSAQTQTAFPPSPSTASETASPSIDMELTLPPAHCSTGPGDVECDFCTERKHKAVKSCLICLTSFCETHLKPHNEVPALKRHKLEEATTQLQKMICPQHYKLMEVYCRTDQSAICCMCMMDEHAGHDTIMLASERNKKESELKKELMKSQQRIQEKEKVVQELKQSVNTIKLSAQTAVEGSERIFTELISSMEKKRWEVTELIRDQEKAELSRAERLLEQLELEIAVLQWRVTELEQLSYTHDHIHFLQRFQSVTSSEYKDSPIITINPRLSLDNVKEYLSGLKMRLEEFCAEEIKFSPPDSAVQMISPSEPQSREDFLKYFCYLTLDPSTVNQHIVLSENNRVLRHSWRDQEYSYNPERFDYQWQVLCKESMCGRCYWEVELTGEDDLEISVSYRENFDESKFEHNNQSWRLRCSSTALSFHHNNMKTEIEGSISSRIGLYMDHSAGTLSFYSVSDTMQLLHRVHTTFTQPLYAGFGSYLLHEGITVRLCDPDKCVL
ncbi:tripartite motif-containing protein 16-like isoform X3 [Neoarius graeffei]|uniref:tripartite motif-containing protein 16-like isoform X3 n=1 Tax=Neoarius graeffei TaxID=443677 RepID=UPI00298CCF5C|nr:tripartite motif-containing protein 16-like isoform X3 [Neoarius graeffei]